MFSGPSDSLLRFVERKGGVCHLCETPVRIDVDGTHPEFPSRDHVIPRKNLKLGTPGKYLLAHSYCNSYRGHKHIKHCQQALAYRERLRKAVQVYELQKMISRPVRPEA